MKPEENSEMCGGSCCAAFCLPYHIDDIRADQDKYPEGRFLADMLVPLPSDTRPEQIAQLKIAPGGHWYTCRHLTEEGRCGAYEQRPRMCRDYPYGKRCNFKWCKASYAANIDTQANETA